MRWYRRAMPIVRTTGPYGGRFIVALARRNPDAGWAGYAKVYDFRPVGFDAPGELADIVGSWVNAPSELDAVESAERVARDVIAQWIADENDDLSS
jgi:hypothetical protein